GQADARLPDHQAPRAARAVRLRRRRPCERAGARGPTGPASGSRRWRPCACGHARRARVRRLSDPPARNLANRRGVRTSMRRTTVLLALAGAVTLALAGVAVADTVIGTAGNDVLNGTAGPDQIYGEDGADAIDGF